MSEGGKYPAKQKTYQVHMFKLSLLHKFDHIEDPNAGRSPSPAYSDNDHGEEGIDFSLFNPSPVRVVKRAGSPSASSSPTPKDKRPKLSHQGAAGLSGLGKANAGSSGKNAEDEGETDMEIDKEKGEDEWCLETCGGIPSDNKGL